MELLWVWCLSSYLHINLRGKGIGIASSQHIAIVQGDFGPQFCPLGRLGKRTIIGYTKHTRPNAFQMGNQNENPAKMSEQNEREISATYIGTLFTCGNKMKIIATALTFPCARRAGKY